MISYLPLHQKLLKPFAFLAHVIDPMPSYQVHVYANGLDPFSQWHQRHPVALSQWLRSRHASHAIYGSPHRFRVYATGLLCKGEEQVQKMFIPS